MSKKNEIPLDNLEECKTLIQKHSFFALLTPKDIDQFAALMKKFSFESGATIVSEEEIVDWIYLIAEGTAEVSRTHSTVATTRILKVGALAKGDCIGLSDSAFSATGFRTATVTATTPMIVYGIPFLTFYNFLRFTNRRYPALNDAGEKILLLNFIVNADLFKHVSLEKVYQLVNKMKEISVPPSTILFEKNENADKAYFILRGKVNLYKIDENQNKELLTQLEQGDLFGKEAFLPDGIRSETATTETDSDLYVMTKEDFRLILKKDSTIIAALKKLPQANHKAQKSSASLLQRMMYKLKQFLKLD